MTSILLESHRRLLLRDVRASSDLPAHFTLLLVTIILAGGLYGAVLGSWHGGRLSLYVSIKIPMLLIGTALLTALFNWIVAALLGLPLQLRQTLALALVPLAIASLVAASLAPVAWFFTMSLPGPSPAQRTLHNILYLTHTGVLAVAGFAGTLSLRQALRDFCGGDLPRAARIHALWIAVYAFVAGELAWILRPFVGSVYLPVVFLREDALRGNVYEFILTDILPHLLRRLL